MFANQFFLKAEVAGAFTVECLSINNKDANDRLIRAAGAVTIDGRLRLAESALEAKLCLQRRPTETGN